MNLELRASVVKFFNAAGPHYSGQSRGGRKVSRRFIHRRGAEPQSEFYQLNGLIL